MTGLRLRHNYSRAAFWLLLVLVVCLTGYSVTAHNPLSRHLLLQTATVVIVIAWLTTRRRELPRWIKPSLLIAAALALLIHCAVADLPFTTVGLIVSEPHASAEVVVVPAHKEDRVDPIPDWLSAHRSISRLNYILDAPITGNQRTLKFKFDRSNVPYRIVEVSYGTDFFRIPFRLSRNQDAQLGEVVRINRTNNRFDPVTAEPRDYYALSTKIRSKPAILIPAVQDYVDQKVQSSVEIFARLIWFSIHLAVILAAWQWQRIIVLTRFNRNSDDPRAN